MATQNKALATAPGNLPMRYDNKSLRLALADRMLLSEALDAIDKLLAMWPNGGRDAGDGYIGALAAVLCDYPRIVVTKCCDPRTGVAREIKFLPTIADIVAFCERETVSLKKPVDTHDRFVDLAKLQQERAEEDRHAEEARKHRPTLAEMREKHGPNWGIDQGRPPKPTQGEARAELIAQIGQAAFDALPDAGIRTDDWQKLNAARALAQLEAAE